MGRFWLGAGILLTFLGLGIASTVYLDSVHEPIAQELVLASEQTLSGDLEEGLRLAQNAQKNWKRHWSATSLVMDHDPVEQIDAQFSQLQAYGRAGYEEEFAAACASLSALITAVGDAHDLTWWNLF